jgi:hypothetical protein
VSRGHPTRPSRKTAEPERAEVACSSGVPASSTSAPRSSAPLGEPAPKSAPLQPRRPADAETNPLAAEAPGKPGPREPPTRAPEGLRIQGLRAETPQPEGHEARPALVRAGARGPARSGPRSRGVLLRQALSPRHHQLPPDPRSEERASPKRGGSSEEVPSRHLPVRESVTPGTNPRGQLSARGRRVRFQRAPEGARRSQHRFRDVRPPKRGPLRGEASSPKRGVPAAQTPRGEPARGSATS